MNSAVIKGFSLAILAAVFWGISGTFGQFLFQSRGIDVTWLITVRMLVSGSLLLLLARFGEKADVFTVWRNRKDAIRLLIFSITGMLAVQYTYFAAMKHAHAATASVLQYFGPIIIAGLLAVQHKRLARLHEAFAILLAVTGTFLLVTHGNFHTLAISGMALFLGLASAVALAVYTLQPKVLLLKYKP